MRYTRALCINCNKEHSTSEKCDKLRSVYSNLLIIYIFPHQVHQVLYWACPAEPISEYKYSVCSRGMQFSKSHTLGSTVLPNPGETWKVGKKKHSYDMACLQQQSLIYFKMTLKYMFCIYRNISHLPQIRLHHPPRAASACELLHC